MPADINVIVTETCHAVFIDESTWNTLPGAPTRVHIPITSNGIRNRPERRAAKSKTGLYQKKHGRNIKAHPSGTIVSPLYGWHPAGAAMSAARFLLEWAALDHEVKFPRSKILEWAEGPDVANRRALGLRVNSMTLSGSAESGIALSLELIGASSTGFSTAAALPTDREKCVEFLFEDSAFTLNSVVTPIASFEWKIQRSLQPLYWDSPTIQSLPKTDWTETFSVTPPKQSDDWEDVRDSLGMDEFPAQLVLKGLHNGTGSAGEWTLCTIDFPRLSLIDVDEQEANGIYNEPLTFAVLKPDTADLSSTMTWSEA